MDATDEQRRTRTDQLRQPSVAELIAGVLRRRILNGDFRDGHQLPKQEELIDEFKVSRPSIREALRILEVEGLVTVRRGKIGGAIVRLPQAEQAAYMFGLVLRGNEVPLDDLAAAMHILEPNCVALCASRPDRLDAIVPRLRELQEEARDNINDSIKFTRLSRQFHEEIVAGCGNQTLILVIGALERIWSAQAQAWAWEATAEQHFPDLDYRQKGLDDHELLLRLIERGDADAAARAAGQHLAWSPVYKVGGEDPGFVRAWLLHQHASQL